MKKLTSLLIGSSLMLTAMPVVASYSIEGELLANANRAKYRRARLMQIGNEQTETETAPEEEPAEEEAPEAEEAAPAEEAPAVEETAPAVEEAPVAPKEVKPSDLQRLQNRTCPRVYRRFSDDAEMMARVNERLVNRFGFQCN